MVLILAGHVPRQLVPQLYTLKALVEKVCSVRKYLLVHLPSCLKYLGTLEKGQSDWADLVVNVALSLCRIETKVRCKDGRICSIIVQAQAQRKHIGQ